MVDCGGCFGLGVASTILFGIILLIPLRGYAIRCARCDDEEED